MTKRAVDIVLGTLLLAIALPVIVAAAVGSAVVLRAWPFFVQDRVGRGGHPFRLVKIRTLPVDTPPYADKYAVLPLRLDPFSALLRRLHIDELPQLALVVRGTMSLVGPRPEMAKLHGGLAPEFAAERLTVRPGCTGLWQVGAHCTGLIGEAPQYDRYYLQHRSLRLDAWIVAQTLRMFVQGGRTIMLDDVPAWARTDALEPSASQPELVEIVATRERTLSQLDLQPTAD